MMKTINNVAISAISTSVPASKVNNLELASTYGEDETLKLISSIGVNTRHVVKDGQTTSNLCFDAASNLFEKSKISPDTIGAVIFLSQTPEYQLPATACVLQSKLGLSSNTIAFDVNLGCSGYVYGLFLASSLVQAGVEKVLLLSGDTISELVKPGDRSTELLFGDAGTATIVESKPGQSLHFELGTDGSGAEHIMARKPQSIGESHNIEQPYLEMNGGEVFTFTLKRVPSLINSVLDELSLESADIDACIYHQANRFMIKHLAKKSKFSMEQVPLSIMDYGNTSCASIPVTLCSQPIAGKSKVLMVGFGVGLSWGAVLADLSNTLCLPVREVDCGE